MQWLQDPNQSNVDNLNNIRREDNRQFWIKKKEYPKPKIDELETNNKIKIPKTCTGASMTLRRVKKYSSSVTGLEWPRGFQEVKAPRFHDNGTGWW